MGFYSKTHFVLVTTTSFKEFLHSNMLFLVNSSLVRLWRYVLHFLSFISWSFLRFPGEKTVENEPDNGDIFGENDQKLDEVPDYNKGLDAIEEKEVENACNSSTSKYQFIAGNSVCEFIKEPENMNFTVHEMFVTSNDELSSRKDYLSFEGDFVGFSVDMNGNSVRPDVIVESHLEEHDSSDDLSREEEFVEKDITKSSVYDLNFRDDLLQLKDLSNEEEVAEQDNTESSVYDLNFRDDLFEHSDCNDLSGIEEVEQNNTEDSVYKLNFRDDSLEQIQHNDCNDLSSGVEEVIEEAKTEISVSDLSSENHEEIHDDSYEEEEQEIANLEDEVVEKVEASGEVHSSLAKSDDFWSSIHKYDCFSGSNDDEFDSDEISCHKVHNENLVNFVEDHSSKSLGISPFDQNNSQLNGIVDVDNEGDDDDCIYIKFDHSSHNSSVQAEEHIPSDEFSDSDEEFDHKKSNFSHLKEIDASKSCEEGDERVGDVLLEQKELIRQMKKEMRQLKTSGLPTILEESESPRVEDDLRPLRIAERMGHKDRMDEIHTFYKRYLDKMRKLDIFSHQTMYAIGLLQLKNQDQLALNKKVSVPVIRSLLAQNFWSYKFRKHEADPVQKLIRDLQNDLELVYVGQVCISWEILKWQHLKVEELQAQDRDGFHQYNQVAGEFQKFQVLLQRFTEDEPYHQGPRVQHYLKSRCGHRNLLQVPLIKEDPRSEWRGDGEGAISITMLKEVIGTSTRAFWDFLRADKDEAHAVTLMGTYGVHVDLEDPLDAELLTETRSSLQKKEKRLKDLVRSGNCLVRKFQKHQDQRLSHEMFLAQVELRMVSRVLNMPKLTTDKLLWCHKKLNKINIIGRKVYIESSFSLFPC